MSAANVRHPLPHFDPVALRVVQEHVHATPSVEVGGILVGHRRGPTPRITASIPARRAIGDITSLTFTHEAWVEMLTIMDREHPDAEVMGWYHSHPGHGIFLSRHDRFLHDNFFSAPWHVAYVVDPQRGSDGLFAWTDAGLELVAGTREAEPLVATEVAEDHVRVEIKSLAQDDVPVATAPHRGDHEPPVMPATRPRLIGLALPIIAGFVFGMLIGFAL